MGKFEPDLPNPDLMPSKDVRNQYRSLDGYWYAENDPKWILNKSYSIYLSKILPNLHIDFHEGFIKTLSHYAQTKSASTTCNIADNVKKMLLNQPPGIISTISLINYRSSLNQKNEWSLGPIRGFLCTWHELGYPGVTNDVVQLLKDWDIQHNLIGEAVQRLDPIEGPFTENEQLAFNQGASAAYDKKLISLSELCISMLISLTGRRPIQIAALKIIDLDDSRKNERGEALHVIHIPRAKQKNGSFRNSFKAFFMTRELWLLLSKQKESSIRLAEDSLGYILKDEDRAQLPLFPDMNHIKNSYAPASKVKDILLSDSWHIRKQNITVILRKISEVGNVFSERTGEPLKVNARRFRYMTGTSAVREGFGVVVVAELLDHSNLKNAQIYIKNIPEHVNAINKAVSHQLAPLAKAFQGLLVDREVDAKRFDDPTSPIRFEQNKVGICGSYDYCDAEDPVPCYTCIHFQPLLDGPHEKIYEKLASDIERTLKATNDKPVASAKNRTMLAVAQVIQMCEKRKNELRFSEVNRG